jgi:hypothetical protein
MTAYIVPQGYYVYTHHRATTGEIFYVGMGHDRRAWDKSKRGKHWKALVVKHGRAVTIVQSGLQHHEAAALERELIALHGRKDLGLGSLVNYTDGGDGTPGTVVSEELAARRGGSISKSLQRMYANGHQNSFKGKRHSVETKAKMSAIKKEAPLPAGFAAQIGKAPPAGWRHTDEARAKLSETRKKRIASKEISIHNAKKLTLIDKGIEFESVMCSVGWLKLNGFPKATHSTIGRAARGLQATAYGYRWAYVDEHAAL